MSNGRYHSSRIVLTLPFSLPATMQTPDVSAEEGGSSGVAASPTRTRTRAGGWATTVTPPRVAGTTSRGSTGGAAGPDSGGGAACPAAACPSEDAAAGPAAELCVERHLSLRSTSKRAGKMAGGQAPCFEHGGIEKAGQNPPLLQEVRWTACAQQQCLSRAGDCTSTTGEGSSGYTGFP
jgi:hypothetical protein